MFRSSKFSFSGSLDDSKSIVNRLLIAQSYFPEKEVSFKSQAEDVTFLKKCLEDLKAGKTRFDIGAGGTSLRFFLARLSREIGTYHVKAHHSLLARPQKDLFSALKQLGTDVVVVNDNELLVISTGWRESKEVVVKSDVSSQFVSALLLNCWNYHQAFTIKLEGELVSESFLDLTIDTCRILGMRIQKENQKITVDGDQKITADVLFGEVDASSLFTLSCFALQFGELNIKAFANRFNQPDFAFLEFYKEWGISFRTEGSEFTLAKQAIRKPLSIDIKNSPDLFPMLCAWLSFCDGEHLVYGAPHLVSKESNRIEKTKELLELAGVACLATRDGMRVSGRSDRQKISFSFDPANDHRMAFAAAFFAFAGFRVELSNTDVVNKSFPQFWTILGRVDERP